MSFSLAAEVDLELLQTVNPDATTPINLAGNEISNTLVGNAGTNTLNGRGGIDFMTGLSGNDTYIVDNVLDNVRDDVGRGSDRVVSISSYVLGTDDEIERLTTSAPDSTYAVSFVGNEFANTIEGNAADNPLNGAAGSDTLTGHGGDDTFRFSTTLGATNIDTIIDFVRVDDTFELHRTAFTGLTPGVLAADAFHIGTAAADAEDRIIYNATTGALTFDSNGNAAGGATQFAILTTRPALTNADFVVV